MEPEFLDPGPDQPYGPGDAPAVEPGAPSPRRRRPDRPTVGLLVMLAAAAVLPVVAAFQLVFTVQSTGPEGDLSFGADGWGRFQVPNGAPVDPQHEPRFGILLTLGGVGFAALALAVATTVLLRPAPERRGVGAAVAGTAGALAGLLVGVTASMVLEIQSVFDRVQASSVGFLDGGRSSIRLQVGAAVWLSLAAVLAGGLAVLAALRVHRSARMPHTSITTGPAGY